MLKINPLILFILFFFISKTILIESKKLKLFNFVEEIINDVQCPKNCFDNKCDNETLKCDSCKNGFYSDQCEKECPAKFCEKCNQKTGVCVVCESGRVLKDDYCCESFCQKCDEDGCLECISLKQYGKQCSDCPSNCISEDISSRVCDQDNGKCFLCNKGYKGNYCNEKCNEGCDTDIKNCDQESGECDCKNGYFGKTCEGKCDEHCLDCDPEDGICRVCAPYYYVDLNDKTKCIHCPENCDGECPNGICIQCIDTFYGDYCDKKCPEKCLNQKCEKKTGQCDCINHYSKESNCTKCENFYDSDKDCNECMNKYDIKSDCVICQKNYDINTGCTKCKNHYSLDNNCQSCIENYDESKECTTCINHYNISTDCKECDNHYNKDRNCLICIENYDKSKECTTCINHYNISTDCKECDKHYDKNTYCNECEIHYDISENCEKCLNYFDIETNCENCLLGYYGLDCNQKCYEGCNLTISNCNQKNGECDICKSGYYGQYCNNTCNENCVGEPPCDPKSGKCDKCKDIYYGEYCQYKTSEEHCIKVDKEDGKCLQCESTYYLMENNTCAQCSSNCSNKLCEDKTGRCYNCSNLNAYGDFCNLNCSKFCNENGENYICHRETAICYKDCKFPGNFTDKKCNKCEQGFYPISEGCTKQCSDNCDDITSCKEEDGSCSLCKLGFWGNKCTEECSNLCNKNGCNKETGKCVTCIDGYFNDEKNDCIECPKNCSTCHSLVDCITCIDGNYGSACQETCSIHCEGSTCAKDGKCICENKYYGPLCDNNCKGCSENGCNDKDGICNDHYCIDNYYDPRMCNETCSENCENNKCDIFTGECISCSDNKWGPYCNYTCSNDCKDDGRLDCCYIKRHEHEKSKGLEIQISYNTDNINKNLKDEQYEFNFINITLGGFNLKILVDFETNSPLVIFDNDTKITPIETEIYNININKKYRSSISDCIKGESTDNLYIYDGFILTKELNAEDNLVIKNTVFKNFSFLICQEYKIEKEFDNAGEINGIVGLGLRNYFTENLFYNDKTLFPKNILIRNIDNKKTHSIYFGDYPEEIKRSFSKLSTMIIDNKQDIIMDQLITFETKFTGIAYSLRKAYHYQYEKKVILNNRIETTIIFNNLYKQFFEKIYFGDLFENGCYFKTLQGGEGEYYCDTNKGAEIQNLPKLGLILGDYIYYLSQDFLFKKSEDYFTFLIKLHGQGQQKIELGKSFFNEFSVIYNNGNETLNFFGDIKKLNVPLRDPSNLLNIDSDLFTPGGWVTLIVFITAIIIIFCYLIKYCGEKKDNEDDEEDDIDYEEDSLIDDTLE